MNIADTAIGIALIALMYLAVRRIRKRGLLRLRGLFGMFGLRLLRGAKA